MIALKHPEREFSKLQIRVAQVSSEQLLGKVVNSH